MLVPLLLSLCVISFGKRNIDLPPPKEKGDPDGRVEDEEHDGVPEATYALELTKDNFEDVVLSNPDKTILLMFYVPWCRYCRVLHPAFEAAAKELADDDNIIVARSDVEKNTERARQYGVEIYPTIVRVDGALDSETRQSGVKFPVEGFKTTQNLINFALAITEEVESDSGAPLVPIYRKYWRRDVMDWLTEGPIPEVEGMPKAQRSKRVFVAYFSKDGCSYCEEFRPTMENLIVPAFRNEPHVRLAHIDCSDERHDGGAALCVKLEINGYPNIVLWSSENGEIVRERLTYPSMYNAMDVVVWINSHAGTRRAPGGGFQTKAFAMPDMSKALANFEDMSATEIAAIDPKLPSKLQDMAATLREADHEDAETAELISTVAKLAVEGGTASGGVTKGPWGGSIITHELDFAMQLLADTEETSKNDWSQTLLRRGADLRLHSLAPLRSVNLLRGRQIRSYADSLGLEKARSATDVHEARAELAAALADTDNYDRNAFLEAAIEAEEEKVEELLKEQEAREKRARLTAGKSAAAQHIELLGTKNLNFFKKRVMTGGSDRYFIWFHLPKCNACEHMEEDFVKLADWAHTENMEHKNDPTWTKLVVGKINNNHNQEITKWLGVTEAPVLIYVPSYRQSMYDPDLEELSEDEEDLPKQDRLKLKLSRLPKEVALCQPPRTFDSFKQCISDHDEKTEHDNPINIKKEKASRVKKDADDDDDDVVDDAAAAAATQKKAQKETKKTPPKVEVEADTDDFEDEEDDIPSKSASSGSDDADDDDDEFVFDEDDEVVEDEGVGADTKAQNKGAAARAKTTGAKSLDDIYYPPSPDAQTEDEDALPDQVPFAESFEDADLDDGVNSRKAAASGGDAKASKSRTAKGTSGIRGLQVDLDGDAIDAHTEAGRCVFVRICPAGNPACKQSKAAWKWLAENYGGEPVRGAKADLVVVDIDPTSDAGKWSKLLVPHRWPQAFLVPKKSSLAMRAPYTGDFKKVPMVDFARDNCGSVTLSG